MSQSNAISSNRLIFVRNAFNADTLQHEDNEILSSLSNLTIEHYSVEELDEKLGHCKDTATLVVSDLNTVISSKQFELSGAFFIACNELSQANVFIPAKPSQKNLFSSIKMGFEFLINKAQLITLSEDINTVSQERKELSEIGIAMSSEKDLDKLLNMVLEEGRSSVTVRRRPYIFCTMQILITRNLFLN